MNPQSNLKLHQLDEKSQNGNEESKSARILMQRYNNFLTTGSELLPEPQ